MDQRCKALLSMLAVTWVLGPNVAMPTEAAELYGPRVHKAKTGRLLSYPYGGTYLRVDLAKRRVGYPYVGTYYGNYYAPTYTYAESYAPAYWNYYDPFLLDSYGGYGRGCYPLRRCASPL
jgi:hypothetical protein